MTKSIGAAVLAVILMFVGLAAINAAAAASLTAVAMQNPQASKPTDLSARRRIRHPDRYAYRPYVQPHYYDRPDYYRPYPYVVPMPFFLGFGFGPGW